jgi:hypothetical protein
MAGQPATFKEADVKRAIRSVQAAGLTIGTIRIGRDGAIEIVPAPASDGKAVDAPKEWHF